MSEAVTLVLSSDTGALAPSSPPPQSSTSLFDFPHDATLHIWRKPPPGTVEPIDGGVLHVSELIHGDGSYILVCFAGMAPDEWERIREQLSYGQRLDLKPLLVGAVDKVQIGSGLWGARNLAGLHSLTSEPDHSTVFAPSPTLMRLLGISRGRGDRTRNALVLIRNGHVVAKWTSTGEEGNQPHDWTSILSMVN